jgi:hypothetical protein
MVLLESHKYRLRQNMIMVFNIHTNKVLALTIQIGRGYMKHTGASLINTGTCTTMVEHPLGQQYSLRVLTGGIVAFTIAFAVLVKLSTLCCRRQEMGMRAHTLPSLLQTFWPKNIIIRKHNKIEVQLMYTCHIVNLIVSTVIPHSVFEKRYYTIVRQETFE